MDLHSRERFVFEHGKVLLLSREQTLRLDA